MSYDAVGLSTFFITGGIAACAIFLILLKWAWDFVNDREFECPKLLMWFPEATDEEPILMILFLVLIIACLGLLSMVWPLMYFVFVVTGALFSFRFCFRTKKKFAKLGSVAHKHPDSVEQSKYDL